MSAFRISINGKPWFDSDDLTTLTMAIEELRRNPRPRISIHAAAGEGPMQWLDADLKAGDTIVIEVLADVEEDEEETSPLVCSFCGRPSHDVHHLLESRSTRLCSVCVADFGAALSNSGALPVGASFRDEPERVCGFCGRHPKDIPGVIVRNAAAICPPCVHASADILSGPMPELPRSRR
jgi:ClpX C4-type zinc finger